MVPIWFLLPPEPHPALISPLSSLTTSGNRAGSIPIMVSGGLTRARLTRSVQHWWTRSRARVAGGGRDGHGSSVAVAAAIIVVTGIVVRSNGYGDDLETEPAFSPSGGADPHPTSDVLDALGHRWSRISSEELAFEYPAECCKWTGRRWTGNEWMADVTVGGPGLVAVGARPGVEGLSNVAVWTSVDGRTWSPVPHDEAVFGGEGAAEGYGGVEHGQRDRLAVRGLVAVGSAGSYNETDESADEDAAVWTSVDGLTWSRVPHDEAVFGGRATS